MSSRRKQGQPSNQRNQTQPTLLLLMGVMTSGFFLEGCYWSNRNLPSVLVVAIEGLGFTRQICGEPIEVIESDGFRVICEESARFTHAYAPSTSSQASMASLLTGLFPHETRVLHNGPQSLSEEFETVAERALNVGYRTSFFSGGAPIFHRSGLGQGFEIFEDNLNGVQSYRTSTENVRSFERWFRSSRSRPFFSVLYLNDILFADVTSYSSSGEVLPRLKSGKQRQISETLFELRRLLRENKQWNSTWVIIVGLNSRPVGIGQPPFDPLDLRSKNTQVALFLKSPSRNSDEGQEQTVDAPVTLADLGVTLFSIFGKTKPNIERTAQASPEAFSLIPLLKGERADYFSERLAPQIAGWSEWKGKGPAVSAVRRGPYLYINKEDSEFYNTLIDRFESNPIPQSDPLWRSVASEMKTLLKDLGLEPSSPNYDEYLMLAQAASAFLSQNDATDSLSFQPSQLTKHPLLQNWYLMRLLIEEKWEEVMALARKTGQRGVEALAAKHLKKPLNGIDLQGCEAALIWKKRDYRRLTVQECSDSLFVKLLDWVFREGADPSSFLLDEFSILYGQVVWEDWLLKKNASLGFIWDIDTHKSARPSVIEVFLWMPQQQRVRRLVRQRVLLKHPNLRFYSTLNF